MEPQVPEMFSIENILLVHHAPFKPYIPNEVEKYVFCR